MPTKTFYTTFTYDEKVEFFVKALMIVVPLAAIMLGEVVIKKIDGDVQRRVKELEGPASPESLLYNVAPEEELEALSELVLEPAHEQAVEQVPEDQVINPYDLRQHKSIFFKDPFCKHHTAEEVAKDLKWCYVLILVLVGLLWYWT